MGVYSIHELNISVHLLIEKEKKMKKMPKFNWFVKSLFCTSYPEISTDSVSIQKKKMRNKTRSRVSTEAFIEELPTGLNYRWEMRNERRHWLTAWVTNNRGSQPAWKFHMILLVSRYIIVENCCDSFCVIFIFWHSLLRMLNFINVGKKVF